MSELHTLHPQGVGRECKDAKKTLINAKTVIASEAKQSRMSAKSMISGSPRHFVPRDDGINQRVPKASTLTLRLTEVFFSLQGETSRAGLPTVFIRLAGCPLRCRWCDTPYSFQGGETVTLTALLAQVAAFGVPTVCVTGGEPLAQKNCLPLLAALCDSAYSVSLETSGALDVSSVDPRVSRIVDIKAPDSGEEARNRWENIAHLTPQDEIKFVLANRADYDWAREVIRAQKLAQVCPVLFSPVQGELPPASLAEWILADRLPVRLQLQLHKVLWGNTPGK